MPSARREPFFGYFFLALAKKVTRLAGRDPPVLMLVLIPCHKNKNGNRLRIFCHNFIEMNSELTC
jgi:hypothetical protein